MLRDYSIDVQFRKVKADFSPECIELLGPPDYSQFSQNLVSMANYLPLLDGVIRIKDPKIITEIGAYRGITSAALVENYGSGNCVIHVVDPAVDTVEIPSSEVPIKYFKELSLEYLERGFHSDIIFLDGDHNYQTVYSELDLIRQVSPGAIVFVHDTGWPCGYRDMYYDLSRVKSKHQTVNSLALDFSGKIRPIGQGIPIYTDINVVEGGEENGVKSALDDF